MSLQIDNESEIEKNIDFIKMVKDIVMGSYEKSDYDIDFSNVAAKMIDDILEYIKKDKNEKDSSNANLKDKYEEQFMIAVIEDILKELDGNDKEEEKVKNHEKINRKISKENVIQILDHLINVRCSFIFIKEELLMPFISVAKKEYIVQYFLTTKKLDNLDFKLMTELVNINFDNDFNLFHWIMKYGSPERIKKMKKNLLETLDSVVSKSGQIEIFNLFFLDKFEDYNYFYNNISDNDNYLIYKPFYNYIVNKKNNKGEYYLDKYIIMIIDSFIRENENKNAGLIISMLTNYFNYFFPSYLDKVQKEKIMKRFSLIDNVYTLAFINDPYISLYYFSQKRDKKIVTNLDLKDHISPEGIFGQTLHLASDLIEQVLAKRVQGLYVNNNIAENINNTIYDEELKKWYKNFDILNLEHDYKKEVHELSEKIKKMNSDDRKKFTKILDVSYLVKDALYKDYDGKDTKTIIKKYNKTSLIHRDAIMSIVTENNYDYTHLIYEGHMSTKIFFMALFLNIKDKSVEDKKNILETLKSKLNTLQCKMLEELLYFIDICKDKKLNKIKWGENDLVKIKLFSKKDVIKKMGSLPKKEGMEDERLELYNKILEDNEYRVKMKNDKLLENIGSLKIEFPHFKEFLEYVEKNAKLNKIGDNTFYIPPTILLGPPGIGKTHFVKTLTEKINGTHTIINMESVESTFRLTGLDYGYSTSSAGMIFENVMKTKYANHIFILDEIDKIKNNMNVKDDVLLTLVEPINAKEFKDSYMDFPIDITNIIWIATANYASQISAPIKSRFQTFNIDYPTFEDKKVIIGNIYKYLLKKESWGNKFKDVMNEQSVCLLAESFNSVRELRKILLDLCSNNIERIPDTDNLREIELIDFPKKIIDIQPWNKRK